MFKIIDKKELAPGIKRIEVEAADISPKVKAGQFVIIRVDEKGERIPLTIADTNLERGTITLIFQEVGKSTCKLGRLSAGGSILDLAGPLGKPTEIKNYGRVIAIGGGVGIAELYPVVRALKEAEPVRNIDSTSEGSIISNGAGNIITGIIGARSKQFLILEDELRELCDELYIATDDGSRGTKGFVSEVLKSEIAVGERIDLVYAIGPVGMMRAVCEITKPGNIKTVVSLNSIMVDGTGMCGSCRVRVGDESRFACVHGPEFDGHKVDFDGLEARLKLFLDAEERVK